MANNKNKEQQAAAAAAKKKQQEEAQAKEKMDKVIEDPEYCAKLGVSDLQQLVRLMAIKLREQEMAKILLEANTAKLDANAAKIDSLENELHIMNERNAEADRKVREAEKEAHVRMFKVEKRELSSNLVIRNMDGDGETKEEVIAKVHGILELMGVSDEVRVRDAVRFRRGKNSNSNKPTIVRVVFEDARMKPIFFKNINKLKGSQWQRISCANEYPACVRPQVADRDFEGMLFRKAHAGAKTKIDWEDATPVLAVRLPEWPVGKWEFADRAEIEHLLREREERDKDRKRNEGAARGGATANGGAGAAGGSFQPRGGPRTTTRAGAAKAATAKAAETVNSDSDASFHEAAEK